MRMLKLSLIFDYDIPLAFETQCASISMIALASPFYRKKVHLRIHFAEFFLSHIDMNNVMRMFVWNRQGLIYTLYPIRLSDRIGFKEWINIFWSCQFQISLRLDLFFILSKQAIHFLHVQHRHVWLYPGMVFSFSFLGGIFWRKTLQGYF